MIQKFNFEKLKLGGAYLIKPFIAYDERGGFIKDYSRETFEQNGIDYNLEEVFYTLSIKGVIRAIHFQEVKNQPKLVRCIKGNIYDVIVDLRKDSPTFKKWLGFYLDDKNNNELLIPKGFGHGYLVLDDSIVSYKCAEKFYGEYDTGIIWNDPDIGIDWPLNEIGGIANLILSDKDKELQSFREYIEKLISIDNQ